MFSLEPESEPQSTLTMNAQYTLLFFFYDIRQLAVCFFYIPHPFPSWFHCDKATFLRLLQNGTSDRFTFSGNRWHIRAKSESLTLLNTRSDFWGTDTDLWGLLQVLASQLRLRVCVAVVQSMLLKVYLWIRIQRAHTHLLLFIPSSVRRMEPLSVFVN